MRQAKGAIARVIAPEHAPTVSKEIAAPSTLRKYDKVEDLHDREVKLLCSRAGLLRGLQEMRQILAGQSITFADDSGSKKGIHYHVMRVITYLPEEDKVYCQTLKVAVLSDGTGKTLDESKRRAFEEANIDERLVEVHASDTASSIVGVNSSNPAESKGETERGRQRLGNSLVRNSECVAHAISNVAKAGGIAMSGTDPDW